MCNAACREYTKSQGSTALYGLYGYVPPNRVWFPGSCVLNSVWFHQFSVVNRVSFWTGSLEQGVELSRVTKVFDATISDKTVETVWAVSLITCAFNVMDTKQNLPSLQIAAICWHNVTCHAWFGRGCYFTVHNEINVITTMLLSL